LIDSRISVVSDFPPPPNMGERVVSTAPKGPRPGIKEEICPIAFIMLSGFGS
jgi:hypothetical protein